MVAELAPRPLLLLHGTADTILPHECSERIYDRAQEPKTLKLFPGVGHRFTEAADELLETARDWLAQSISDRDSGARSDTARSHRRPEGARVPYGSRQPAIYNLLSSKLSAT